MAQVGVRLILLTFLGIVTMLTFEAGMYMISHIVMLLFGMILGAIVSSDSDRLEGWSKGKLKKGLHV